MSCKKIYITTPIYYVNAQAHIGHAYTTIIADTVARYSRMVGYDTYFLTGTDEHGQKIQEAAAKQERPTQAYADEISKTFRDLWDDFEITYDQFIRTTDEMHKKGVQHAFAKMLEKGDIYKDTYEGHYCVSCETFFTPTQLVDDILCPDCGRPTRLVKEESYFFRLSKYEKPLLEWYAAHDDVILPRSRKNEVVRFVEQGLRDLSITRTSFDWGVKLPASMNEPKHVMYVWLDALMNYVTALGYGTDEAKMEYWPAKVQLVGKDILRFHAIYWPAFLMSLDLPLPTHIAAHGWWTRDGEKMSKSKGNVVDPKAVSDAYGNDTMRYFLLREVPFGQDGDFSQRALIGRINSDLSNDLGNLLNRVIGMSEKYSDGLIDSVDVGQFHQGELDQAHTLLESLSGFMYEMQTHRYLEELWRVFVIANKAITDYEPWVKIKSGDTPHALATVALIANLLAKASVMLYPVMPKTANTIANTLGFVIDNSSYTHLIIDKGLLSTFTIKKQEPLFPRLEAPLLAEAPLSSPNETQAPKIATSKETPPPSTDGLITIDQFFATSLKIGTIVALEEVPKSDKLYKLQVDLGEEAPRQIVAGIRLYYAPDALLNTQVCVVANLKPAKLMGLHSYGMLLAAKDSEGLSLIRPEKPRTNGASIG
ncbi:MAG: methionyl-tRNA synthetase [Sulfuricurvum sp. PC08-66]|nr:MAG: methionyl-tRNA synthetase [Sulfuricurvum sp. PC08-66]